MVQTGLDQYDRGASTTDVATRMGEAGSHDGFYPGGLPMLARTRSLTLVASAGLLVAGLVAPPATAA